jgi:hypothetical protein
MNELSLECDLKSKTMRRVRDKNLPVPFRQWIDRDYALPSDVTVLPRVISPLTEFMLFVVGLAGCGAMGTLLFTVIPEFTLSSESWIAIVLIAAAMLGYLLWVGRRLWTALAAYRDRKAGDLRLGIIVGPEGVLVRMNPGRCYPVFTDRFVRAEPWSGGGENGSDYLRIVTKDGPIDIWDHDIVADATEVNRVIESVVVPVTIQRAAKGK